MVITKKSLPRRTVLRGLGAAIGLPLLDGMVPAFAAIRNSAARPVKRLGAFYVPNGMSMPYWVPKQQGPLELTPSLTPLAPVQDQVHVLSGLANEEAKQWLDEGDGDHSRCQAAFLTGAHARKASGANTTLHVGVSMDQLAARELREDTQLASLELSLEANELVGQCEDGYGCAYSATLAWRDANTPMPMQTNPRAVFEHLFGVVGSTETKARLQALRRDRSILDSVSEELSDLQRQLGRGDRSKLGGYLDSVRDIERRIQIAESQSDRELPDVVQPEVEGNHVPRLRIGLQPAVQGRSAPIGAISVSVVVKRRDGGSVKGREDDVLHAQRDRVADHKVSVGSIRSWRVRGVRGHPVAGAIIGRKAGAGTVALGERPSQVAVVVVARVEGDVLVAAVLLSLRYPLRRREAVHISSARAA